MNGLIDLGLRRPLNSSIVLRLNPPLPPEIAASNIGASVNTTEYRGMTSSDLRCQHLLKGSNQASTVASVGTRSHTGNDLNAVD